MKQNRRRFLGTVTGTGLAAGCRAAGAEEKELLPIIDTHQHLWNLEKFTLPWVAGGPEVLQRSYVTRDYVEATKGLNVVKAIYMEVDVRPDLQVKEAEYVIEISRSPSHPTVAGVISGRPGSEKFKDYISKYKGSPYIKGVRQVLQVPETPKGFCLQKQFVKNVQLLGELRMSFDICIRPSELSDGWKLADKCPDTLHIVDHCGNADPKAWLPEKRRGGEKPWHEIDQWKRDIDALAKRRNVICKISGIIARAPAKDWSAEDLAPAINFCLDAFGPDRVVYGGDWPVCKLTTSYKDWVRALKEVIASRPREQQKKLLHDNSIKYYHLT